MCGHIGFASISKTINRESLRSYLRVGLFLDQLRGTHGTGIASRAADGTISSYKRALAASDFLQLEAAKRQILSTYSFAIGHNRAATGGSIDDDCTHPFEVDDLILAHNGTLRELYSLDGVSSLDSRRIAQHIAKNKLSIKEMLEDLRGSFALVWYDGADDTINLCRNEERPMYYATNNTYDSVFWGSEDWMVRTAAGRAGIKLNDPIELPVGKWMKIPLDTVVSADKIWSNEWKTIPFTPRPTITYNSYGGYWQDDDYPTPSSQKRHLQVVEDNKTKDIIKVLQERNLKKGDIVEICLDNIAPLTFYKNSKEYGSMPAEIHTVKAGETIPATIHGMNTKLYDELETLEPEYSLFAEVLSGYISKESNELVVILTEPYVDTTEDAPTLSEEELAATHNGCNFCGKIITTDDHMYLAWTYNHKPICSGCICDHVYSKINIKELDETTIPDTIFDLLDISTTN